VRQNPLPEARLLQQIDRRSGANEVVVAGDDDTYVGKVPATAVERDNYFPRLSDSLLIILTAYKSTAFQMDAEHNDGRMPWQSDGRRSVFAGIQRLQLVPRGHHRAVLYFAITGKFSPLYLIWIWPVGDLSAYLIGQIATRSAMKKMNAALELDKLCMELVGLGSSRNRPPTRDVREEFREMTLKMLQETGVPNLIS